MRPYTPINQHEVGVLNLLIKKYEQGNVSKFVHSLKVGDKADIKGPFPKLKYEANKWKNIGMVAGGTGLTPMLQVVDEIFSNESDKTNVILLTANVSSKDVLLREKMDAIAAKHPQQFKVIYITDKKEEDHAWIQENGYVTQQLLEKYLPKPAADTLIYTCGPPSFMAVVSGDKQPDKSQGPLVGHLKAMGYDESMVCKQ